MRGLLIFVACIFGAVALFLLLGAAFGAVSTADRLGGAAFGAAFALGAALMVWLATRAKG